MPTSNWNDKYLELAKHFSTWSKDPSTKIGAVAIGKHGQVLSQGYNGFPRRIKDDERLLDRSVKYGLTVHAEMNCIFNAALSGISLEDSFLYVYGLTVCNECAKGVIQSGIQRVYVLAPTIPERWLESTEITKKMFEEAGVGYHVFEE